MTDDSLVQRAERALLDAERAHREDPSPSTRRRVMRAWSEVQSARGEVGGGDEAPYPLPGVRPARSLRV